MANPNGLERLTVFPPLMKIFLSVVVGFVLGRLRIGITAVPTGVASVKKSFPNRSRPEVSSQQLSVLSSGEAGETA